MKRFVVACIVVLGSVVAGVPAPVGAAPPTTITLVTHDSFAASKSVLAAFTRQSGVKVRILQSGDAGAALNQAILGSQGGAPLGDVFLSLIHI